MAGGWWRITGTSVYPLTSVWPRRARRLPGPNSGGRRFPHAGEKREPGEDNASTRVAMRRVEEGGERSLSVYNRFAFDFYAQRCQYVPWPIAAVCSADHVDNV